MFQPFSDITPATQARFFRAKAFCHKDFRKDSNLFCKKFGKSENLTFGGQKVKLSVNRFGRDRIVNIHLTKLLACAHKVKDLVGVTEGGLSMCWKSGTLFHEEVPVCRLKVGEVQNNRNGYDISLLKEEDCPTSVKFDVLEKEFATFCAA